MTDTDEPAVELPPGPSVDADRGQLTFVGNATVVLRYGGFTVLTDPNFLHAGEHAYLGLGFRSRRLQDPALEVDQLPDIDFVVLSLHHGDHFDRVAADRLDKDLPIVTEPDSARKLVEQGFRRAIPLPTWHTQLCLIHLGGTKVAGILLTMDAEQGVKALRIVRPRTAVPIHQDDYTVFTSGPDDLRRAVDRARLATVIHEVGRGETWTFDVPRGGAATP